MLSSVAQPKGSSDGNFSPEKNKPRGAVTAPAKEPSSCDAAVASFVFPFQAEQTCVNTLLKFKKKTDEVKAVPL